MPAALITGAVPATPGPQSFTAPGVSNVKAALIFACWAASGDNPCDGASWSAAVVGPSNVLAYPGAVDLGDPTLGSRYTSRDGEAGGSQGLSALHSRGISMRDPQTGLVALEVNASLGAAGIDLDVITTTGRAAEFMALVFCGAGFQAVPAYVDLTTPPTLAANVPCGFSPQAVIGFGAAVPANGARFGFGVFNGAGQQSQSWEAKFVSSGAADMLALRDEGTLWRPIVQGLANLPTMRVSATDATSYTVQATGNQFAQMVCLALRGEPGESVWADFVPSPAALGTWTVPSTVIPHTVLLALGAVQTTGSAVEGVRAGPRGVGIATASGVERCLATSCEHAADPTNTESRASSLLVDLPLDDGSIGWQVGSFSPRSEGGFTASVIAHPGIGATWLALMIGESIVIEGDGGGNRGRVPEVHVGGTVRPTLTRGVARGADTEGVVPAAQARGPE